MSNGRGCERSDGFELSFITMLSPVAHELHRVRTNKELRSRTSGGFEEKLVSSLMNMLTKGIEFK